MVNMLYILFIFCKLSLFVSNGITMFVYFTGLLLLVGGFINFMVSGSIPAIRFGVILGGALFALSLASLKSHRKGESSTKFLKGQMG